MAKELTNFRNCILAPSPLRHERGIPPIGRPGHHTDEFIPLVGDPHLAERHFVMRILVGQSGELVTLHGRPDEGDAMGYAHGHETSAVDCGGKSQVGQCEERSALTDTGAVEVMVHNGHHGLGAALSHLDHLNTSHGGETVILIEKIDQFHFSIYLMAFSALTGDIRLMR